MFILWSINIYDLPITISKVVKGENWRMEEVLYFIINKVKTTQMSTIIEKKYERINNHSYNLSCIYIYLLT